MTQRPPYLFASSSHIGLKEKRNRLQNGKIENKTFDSYSILWRFLGNWKDTIIYPVSANIAHKNAISKRHA